MFQQALKEIISVADRTVIIWKVWYAGDCYFPDFTHPDVRKWWSGLYKELFEQGVSGVWNDMNEPGSF